MKDLPGTDFVKTNALVRQILFFIRKRKLSVGGATTETISFPAVYDGIERAYGQIAITKLYAIRGRDGDQITPSLGLLSHMTKRGQSLQNSDRSFAAKGDSKSCAHSTNIIFLFYRII